MNETIGAWLLLLVGAALAGFIATVRGHVRGSFNILVARGDFELEKRSMLREREGEDEVARPTIIRRAIER